MVLIRFRFDSLIPIELGIKQPKSVPENGEIRPVNVSSYADLHSVLGAIHYDISRSPTGLYTSVQ